MKIYSQIKKVEFLTSKLKNLKCPITSVSHSFMLQDSKVSFEYVEFCIKISLILHAAFGNKITKQTLLHIQRQGKDKQERTY